jgi:hypothetical protein
MKVRFSEVQTGTAVVSAIPASAKQAQMSAALAEPPVGVPQPNAPDNPVQPPQAAPAPPPAVGSKCFSCGSAFKIDIYDGDFCPVCGVNLSGPGSVPKSKREKKSGARARAAGGKESAAALPASPQAPPVPVAPPAPPLAPPAPMPAPPQMPPVGPVAPPAAPFVPPDSAAVVVHPPGPSVVVLPSARPANPDTRVMVIPAASKSGVSLYDPSTWIDENNVPISMEDVFMPRINIVQKVGDLSNVHVHGSIVLNQTLAVYVPNQTQPDGKGGVSTILGTPPIRVVIACFRPMQYVEKVVGADHRGEMFNTPEEVLAVGGTLDYAEAQSDPNKTLYQKMATALVIIQKPAAVTDLESFPYEWAGGRWAPALWSMKGTAFTHAYKIVATQKQHGPMRGRKWYERAWLLSTQIKKFNQNFAFVPVIKLDVETGPDFLALIQTILNQPRTASTEQEGV